MDNGITSDDDIYTDPRFAHIFADSPQFEIPYDKIAELEQREAERLANKAPSAASVHKADIKRAVERWRTHEDDVGSPEVQIAIAHERIRYLTEHLLHNKKDLASKRGLQALVVARRKSLEYLTRTDPDKARQAVEELGIRFQAPGHQWDRQTRYGAFRNTKSKHAKILMAKVSTPRP
jgi:small subunit ribosomal protein S15